MFNRIKNRTLLFAGALFMAASFTACSKSDGDKAPTDPVKPEFALWYSTANGSYLLPINDLMSGTISPIGKGTDVTNIFTWEENIIQKGNIYYHLEPTSAKFGKYSFENGTLQTIKVIPFTAMSYLYLGWHTWLDNKTLMIGGRGNNEYAVIDVDAMTVIKSGVFDTGKEVPADHTLSVHSIIPQGGKIFLGFGLKNNITSKSYDTAYTATLNYPALDNFKITGKDTRSAPLGALRNGYFHKFTDNSATYVLTHPMPMLGGNKPDMPTGFFRIKDGSTVVDPDYFFNISALTQGDNQLGVAYLGNGKALLINARDAKNVVKERNDWWYKPMWEYIIVDVNTKQVVRKLDFPGLLNSRSAVVHDGKAYIAVNDPSADAIYIWEYNSQTDKLTKGAKIEGGDNDTPVLYKLN